MSREVEQIKDRLDIVSVISGYLQLHKAGANYKANCPFHNEKTPSFFISPSRNTYYCFGCGAKGDIFTFTQEMEGLDFRGALEFLAPKAGVVLKKNSPEMREESDRILSAIQTAAEYFESNLTEDSEAHKYLLKRGLTNDTIKRFHLGFALPGWRNLREYLTSRSFTDTELIKAGLIKVGEKGNEPYDVFRDRIIFPLCESSGKIVGFSGRTMDEETNPPKYLNSPDSPYFSKGELLYGLDKAKNEIRQKNFSVLVEGQMDLLMSHQSGIANTIAASGTAVTISHLERLKKISPRILIALDADGAGVKSALRTATLALQKGMEVKIASMQGGKDPADLILKDLEKYKDVLRSAAPFIEFVLGMIMKDTQDERNRAKRVEKEIIPLLSLLQSAVERSHAVKQIAKISKISERAIEEDVVRYRRSAGRQANYETSEVKNGPAVSVYNQIERHAVGLLFAEEAGTKFPINIIENLSFLNDIEKGAIISRYKPEQENLIFEVENYYGNDSSIEASRHLEEVILNFKEDILKKRLAELTRELSIAEEKKDKAKAKEVLQSIQSTSNEREEIIKLKSQYDQKI